MIEVITLKNVQFVCSIVFGDLKEDSFTAIVQQIVDVKEGILNLAPINKDVSKTSNGVCLNALKRFATFGGELLEYCWGRRSGIIWVSHCFLSQGKVTSL